LVGSVYSVKQIEWILPVVSIENTDIPSSASVHRWFNHYVINCEAINPSDQSSSKMNKQHITSI